MNNLLLTLCLAVPLTASAGDWPQFLGANRDSRSSETGLVSSFPKKGPPVVWTLEVGEGHAAPVVKGQRLILFHRVGNKDRIECLHALTKKRLWKFDYETSYRDQLGKGDGPRSTPLITDKHVYALSADGRLHCLTLEKGTKVWLRNLSKDYQAPQGYFGCATSPIQENGLIVVNIGGAKAGIVAVDEKTGKMKWTATDHQRSYASPVAMTVDRTRHLIFFTRRGVVSLDPTNGKVRFDRRWRARMAASVNATSPVVIGKHLFVSSSYQTGAFVAEVQSTKLKDLWSNDESLSAHFSPCAIGGDFIYGFDGRQEEGARLRCVEWKTGKVRWNKARLGCGSLILADGKLIILTEDGDLVLVKETSQSYQELARSSVLEGTCRAQLALSNGRLYARDDSTLICLDLRKK